MAKHRKCDNCDGRGSNIVVITDSNGRPKSVEKTCSVCKGTGFMEVARASNDEIRISTK